METVGGWHPCFQELRRDGHTEHSYRIYNAGLTPAPFNYIESLRHSCNWKNPTSVVIPDENDIGENELFKVENELIERNLGKQPFYAKYPGRLCRAMKPQKRSLVHA